MREIVELNAGWHYSDAAEPDVLNAGMAFRLPCALRHAPGTALVLAKQLFAPEKWQGKRLLLACRGINRDVSLSLNGKRIAVFANTPFFETDIGAFLRYGQNNLIQLLIPDEKEAEGACFLRGMHLIVAHAVSFATGGTVAYLRAEEDGALALHIRAELCNSSAEKRKVRFSHILVSSDGKKSKKWTGACALAAGATTTVEKTEKLTPAQQEKYAGGVCLLHSCLEEMGETVDEADMPVRLRDRRIGARGCLTQEGRPAKLKALYDTSVPLCRPTSDEILQMEYRTWGELGADTLLLPVDINIDRRLDALDKSGRFAIVRLPDEPESGEKNARRETILALRHHASLLAWSVGSVSDSPALQEDLLALRQTCALLSPAVCLTGEVDLRLSNKTANAFDFLILKRDADQLSAVHKKYPSKPLLLLSRDENEFFAFQRAVSEKDYCLGILQCADRAGGVFLSESAALRISLGMPRLRERLQAAFVSPAKVPVVALQRETPAPGQDDVPFLAMSNCPQLALWIDGRPLPGMEMQKQPFCHFTAPSDFGYLQAIGFYRGREVARVEREAVSAPYALSLSLVTASGRPGTSRYLYLCCTAVDTEGREVRDAEADVTVSLSGSVAVDDPHFAEPQTTCALALREGRACVPLCRIGEGPFTAKAESTVLLPAQIRI